MFASINQEEITQHYSDLSLDRLFGANNAEEAIHVNGDSGCLRNSSLGFQHENVKEKPAKRSNKIRTRSGNTSHGPPARSQNKRGPSEALNKKRNGSVQTNKQNAAEANKNTGKQSSSTAPKQQIWQVKTKPEPSSTKSTSKDSKAKERAAAPSGTKEKALPSKVNQKGKKRAEPSNTSSTLPSGTKEKALPSKVDQKGKKKAEPSNNSSTLPAETWRVKEKKQPPSKDPSKSSSKRRKSSSQQRSRNENYHIDHHIEREDIDETEEPIGYLCCLCENDLAFAPSSPEIELEVTNFPDTAILPCDHTFHVQCLEMAMLQENLKDPPCIICLSLTGQE